MNTNSIDTASTLVVGAVGMVLPSLIISWVTLIVGVLSGIWVIIQIIHRLTHWNK